KHAVRVSVTNLYSDEVGNPNLPGKLRAFKKHHARVRWAAVAIGLLVLGAVVAAFMIVSRRPTTSLTAIPEKSIAVLPFVDMSAGKDQEYFSDGISEELLNLLAKIPQLQVTARTSSFAFKGKETSIPEIARTLHVAHVLEGSVRKAGNSVRITAQLIKAGTDTHLWSQTYDRKLDDIFAIQDEIAADVVKQLKVTLLGAAPKARTTDPEAYALYLQAVQLGRQFTAGAAQHFRRALALDPADLDVLRNSVMLLAALGRLDESLALNQALVRRDPVNVNTLFNLGLFQRRAGRLDAAIASQRTVLSLAP